MFDGSSVGGQAVKDYNDLCNEKAMGSHSGRIQQIEALISSFPSSADDGEGCSKTAPMSPLGSALNNMLAQYNSLLSQVITEVDHPQPILEHIKETAEFSVKQFRDACLEMNSELTRISMDWQLKFSEEMSKQEIVEYENSIRRQENLLSKLEKKLDDQILNVE